jgi:hypothetical protein
MHTTNILLGINAILLGLLLWNAVEIKLAILKQLGYTPPKLGEPEKPDAD